MKFNFLIFFLFFSTNAFSSSGEKIEIPSKKVTLEQYMQDVIDGRKTFENLLGSFESLFITNNMRDDQINRICEVLNTRAKNSESNIYAKLTALLNRWIEYKSYLDEKLKIQHFQRIESDADRKQIIECAQTSTLSDANEKIDLIKYELNREKIISFEQYYKSVQIF